MSTQAQTEPEAQDRLGMTEEQWAQWQAYTHGYGDQDENGIDVSLLRQNLRLTPWERLEKLQRGLAFFTEDGMEPPNDFQQAIKARLMSPMTLISRSRAIRKTWRLWSKRSLPITHACAALRRGCRFSGMCAP